MFKKFALVLTASSLLCLSGFAQDHKDIPAGETAARIPVLTDFHEVIFKIWHTAWPEKNVAMLAELLPQVRSFSDSLAKVQLPDILRDKEEVWNENTAKLKAIASAYAQAATPVDSQKLLAAAESLHSQYETLVRVIQPALPEIEEFHQILYMLYHYYVPDHNTDKIVSSVKQLKEKMAALDKAALPERLNKIEAAFLEARAKLARSVQALDTDLATQDLQELEARIETVHTDYQALDKLFD